MTKLCGRVTVWALLALLGSVGAAAACVVPANADALRAELVSGVNAQRARAGLPALPVSARLERLAQDLACDNATRGRLSHTDAPGRDLRTRLRAGGYSFRYANENIASHRTVSAAIQAWMGSQVHRDNIHSNRAREIGGGVARTASGQTYWVTISGAAR